MLAAIALTPSAPVLVPDLAGGAAAEVAELREAAIAAAAALPDRWVAIGVAPADQVGAPADQVGAPADQVGAPADQVVAPQTRATFAGYGADVEVTLAPQAPTARTAVPLAALWAGWLRGQANPRATVEVRVYSASRDGDAALAAGRALRAEIDAVAERVGVLVIADGANTLNQAAPGGYDPAAESVQAGLDRALAIGDAAALTALPPGIIGRVAYQVLAGLVDATPCTARELACGAPYGVGYFVGLWTPSHEKGP